MIGISFQRNEQKNCTTVWAKIVTDLPIESNPFWFRFDCKDDFSAELLANYLDERFSKAIETAHKNGYQQGWKDAKSKKKKATSFAVSFGKPDEQIAW